MQNIQYAVNFYQNIPNRALTSYILFVHLFLMSVIPNVVMIDALRTKPW